MATTWRRPDGKGQGDRARPELELVDEMLARYVNWRERAAAVRDAYAHWCDAPKGDGTWLFAAYMAALEQEESAAISYASVVGDLRRMLTPARDA